ncbi:glycosyl hydrolase family 18 protein [Pseudopedobacter beijingensis]|uniref:chitinase n=1 Tax=Pseudopedobacter beijingensis TaxID=1207056 RepID=A0ABW4IEA5_9SPHI
MKRLLILSIAAIASFSSCKKDIAWVPDGYGAGQLEKPTTPYKPDESFKRVIYYPAYRAIADIDTTSLDGATHVIYSFLKPKADGTVILDNSKNGLKEVVTLIKRHKAKAIIALNGDSKIYTTLLSNPVSRKSFINNIVKYTLENQFDGVDMDWEYPDASKGNDVSFGIFMQELANELNSWHRSLSMAVTAGVYAGPIKDGITQNAIDACDFVNLMVYDGAGWAGDSNHSSYKMAEDVLDVWLLQKGLPKKKAVLGLPAYGKTSDNKDAVSFRDLLSNGADKDANIHTYTVDSKVYYYNGFPLIQQKVQLAKDRANGIMFWEIGQDAKGDLSLIKFAYKESIK